MKDWDFDADVRAVNRNYKSLFLRLKSLSNDDARSGAKRITVKQAQEICRACDDFFRRRGMWVWENRLNIINNKKDENKD